MKALFTDLDGTVIFSRRTCGPQGVDGLRPVEHYNGAPSSFMTATAYGLATRLVAADALVPVTTRTAAQYRRIDVLSQARIAISDNGAQVHVDGAPDPQWARHIATLVPDDLAERHRSLREALAPLGWNAYSTGFMLYAVAPTGTTTDDFQAVARSRSWNGMSTHLHRGRKVYWIPDGITKGAAARFAADKYGRRIVLAAGDEHLDLPLLAEAENAVTLANTGIADQIEHQFEAGPRGGESILARAAALAGLA